MNQNGTVVIITGGCEVVLFSGKIFLNILILIVSLVLFIL